jgi:hypothetical protein
MENTPAFFINAGVFFSPAPNTVRFGRFSENRPKLGGFWAVFFAVSG